MNQSPFEEEPFPDRQQVSAAWQEEILRRAKEIEDGTARTIPGEEVMRRFREKFGLCLDT